MLPLDSPRWNALPHAYGVDPPAPSVLRALTPAASEESLSVLWDCFLHQTTVYPATFAATPHLVALLPDLAFAPRVHLLTFLGTVAAYTEAPDLAGLDADIRDWHQAALERAQPLAYEAYGPAVSQDAAPYLFAAIAGLFGHRAAGRFLEGFADEEFAPSCRNCGRQLYVWPSPKGMSVAAEDPSWHPDTRRTDVAPASAKRIASHETFTWLSKLAARRPTDATVRLLPYLFGTAVCPHCETACSLYDRLVEESGAR